MSEVEVIKLYRVGNESFDTQEEAERYLEEQKKLVLLENPIYKDSEFQLLLIMSIMFIKVESMSTVIVWVDLLH